MLLLHRAGVKRERMVGVYFSLYPLMSLWSSLDVRACAAYFIQLIYESSHIFWLT